MNIEDAVIGLTTQTTNLLDTFNAQLGNVESRIVTAVGISQSSAIEPIITLCVSIVSTQIELIKLTLNK